MTFIHTHSQTTPSKDRTKAWLRLYLLKRINKNTDKQSNKKEYRSDNTGFDEYADLPGRHITKPNRYAQLK